MKELINLFIIFLKCEAIPDLLTFIRSKKYFPVFEFLGFSVSDSKFDDKNTKILKKAECIEEKEWFPISLKVKFWIKDSVKTHAYKKAILKLHNFLTLSIKLTYK